MTQCHPPGSAGDRDPQPPPQQAQKGSRSTVPEVCSSREPGEGSSSRGSGEVSATAAGLTPDSRARTRAAAWGWPRAVVPGEGGGQRGQRRGRRDDDPAGGSALLPALGCSQSVGRTRGGLSGSIPEMGERRGESPDPPTIHHPPSTIHHPPSPAPSTAESFPGDTSGTSVCTSLLPVQSGRKPLLHSGVRRETRLKSTVTRITPILSY